MSTKHMEKIPLLYHHARLMIPYWLGKLHGAVEDLVTGRIIPWLELETIQEKPAYPFLCEPKPRERMVFGLITAFNAFLKGLYYEIPDNDPDTGLANTDVICDNCGNNADGVCIFTRDDGP